jgi:cytochrome bd ubiquinol oxidase subunit II
MVSSTNPAYNLTVDNTASEPYSLHAMTVVVIIFLPIVLAYQCWTYYVFRRRISREQFLPAPPPPPPPVPTQPVPAQEGLSSAASGTPPPAHGRWIRGGPHGRKL